MRMQVEYEYSDGKRGLRLFDIGGDLPDGPSQDLIDACAALTVPEGASIIKAGENKGKPPYDEKLAEQINQRIRFE
jgi:hypothetical protein